MEPGSVALIAGAATVIGAAMGAGGTILSARHTGKAQFKSQHAHWRLQSRRDAYVAFTAAVKKMETYGHRAFEDWVHGVPGASERSVFRQLESDVIEAQAAVTLEGPYHVTEALDQVIEAMQDWAVGVHMACFPMNNTQDDQEFDFMDRLNWGEEVIHWREEALQVAVRTFHEACRVALDAEIGVFQRPLPARQPSP